IEIQVVVHLLRTNSYRVIPEFGPVPQYRTYTCGILGAIHNPRGLLLTPLYHPQDLHWKISGPVIGGMRFFINSPRRRFSEETLPGNGDGQEDEHCLVLSETGAVWQSSRSLGGASFRPRLPAVEQLKPLDLTYDEPELRPGVRVLRVTIKVPAPRYFFS